MGSGSAAAWKLPSRASFRTASQPTLCTGTPCLRWPHTGSFSACFTTTFRMPTSGNRRDARACLLTELFGRSEAKGPHSTRLLVLVVPFAHQLGKTAVLAQRVGVLAKIPHDLNQSLLHGRAGQRPSGGAA